jgi:hypothetical protein
MTQVVTSTPPRLRSIPVGLMRQGDAMAIITCVTTPHKGLDFTVNYVWHLKERMNTNARPFKHSSLASAVAAQAPSSKLPIFGVVGVRPSAARALPLGEGEEQEFSDDRRHSGLTVANGSGCAASLRGPVGATRFATLIRSKTISHTAARVV